MSDVTFITGNQNKADYLARLLGIEVRHQKVDLEEIQSLDLHEIVEYKARKAYEVINSPVLVEDVALEFTALNGLPGAFVKFFVETTGDEAMCRMLDGFADRSATAKCVFCYFDGKDLTFIEGSLAGEIVRIPTGENGYGWDKVFAPEGYGGRTRAELTPEEDEITYRQIKNINGVAAFLKRL